MDNTILNKFLDSFSEHPEKWSVKGAGKDGLLRIINENGAPVDAGVEKNAVYSIDGSYRNVVDLKIVLYGKYSHKFTVRVKNNNVTETLSDFVQEEINRQYRSDLKEIEGFL